VTTGKVTTAEAVAAGVPIHEIAPSLEGLVAAL
jgi:hypothetical protein